MKRVNVRSMKFYWVAVAALALACGGSDVPEAPELQNAVEPAGSEAAAPPEAAVPDPQSPRLALWVLCEGSQRVLDHPERIPDLLAYAQKLGASDLFIQVYRGGRAWFPSSLADTTPFAPHQASGRDPFAELLAQAQQAGIRVHAWVNVLSLASNRKAPIVQDLGSDAVHVDAKGRSVLSYPDLEIPPPEAPHYRMGTPAVWLDPAAPGVADWLAVAFAELVELYPTLDGLHLDYIRYPDVLPFPPGSRFGVGLDFGYGEASRQRFEQDTGRKAPGMGSLANANRWDHWRRDQLTALVLRIRSEARRVNPNLQLSVAAWAYAERAYHSIYQDWRRWLEDGLIEFAVPMLYTLDDRLLRYELAGLLGGVGGDKVWAGLGSWLFAKQPQRALAQLDLAHDLGAPGVALFSYDSIAEAPALREALLREATRVEQ